MSIRIKSEANLKEHGTLPHKRHRDQRVLINMIVGPHVDLIKLPCTITFVRIAPRFLDDDNLAFAFKSFRDYLSNLLIPGLRMGRADADPRLRFAYAQDKAEP